MSAIQSAIQWDAVDVAYYKTQLIQLRESFQLLLDIQEKGIMAISKFQLDNYHDATWNMNLATTTYSLKTNFQICCSPLCCASHGYCFGCWPWCFMKKRNQLIYDRRDVKEFLRMQELRSRAFTKEQLIQFISEARKTLDSEDNSKIMKVAEELDLIDRKLSLGANMMNMMPNMAQMMNMTQIAGQMQNMQKVSPSQDTSMYNMQAMPMQGMDMQSIPMQIMNMHRPG